MDASAFEQNLRRALELCRHAAAQELPIAEMLEWVEDAIEAVEVAVQGGTDREVSPERSGGELVALRIILKAVGDVAAIGAKLPPVPTEPSFPMPANLRG